MKRIVIESPYAGEGDKLIENVLYLRACMNFVLSHGHAPYASHGLYTQPGVLDDGVPEERKKGIQAGFAWGEVADEIWFFTDLGWSGGMKDAQTHWEGKIGTEDIHYHTLGPDWREDYLAIPPVLKVNKALWTLGIDQPHPYAFPPSPTNPDNPNSTRPLNGEEREEVEGFISLSNRAELDFRIEEEERRDRTRKRLSRTAPRIADLYSVLAIFFEEFDSVPLGAKVTVSLGGVEVTYETPEVGAY